MNILLAMIMIKITRGREGGGNDSKGKRQEETYREIEIEREQKLTLFLVGI